MILNWQLLFSRQVVSISLWLFVSSTVFQSLLKFMSIVLVMLSNHLILCHSLLLLPQSFPASGAFPMNQLFLAGGQSRGASASASALPMTTQGWLPLGLTGLISWPSKGLYRVFSSTTIQRHQFFGAQPSLLSMTPNNSVSNPCALLKKPFTVSGRKYKDLFKS